MSDPKLIALTAATRANYLSESDGPFVTDAQIHRETSSTISLLMSEVGLLKKYAEHLPDCSCWDKMDSGRLFPRHDWACDCGLREVLK